MHNKQDVAVPLLQSVEYYLRLRFLGKSVWMLQYDNGGHELDYETEALDYTKRLIQYFDHYLKGKTCTLSGYAGRPATLKQIDDRFELDPDGSCGEDCKIYA